MDAEIVLWVNQWAGRYAAVGWVESVAISDYFFPACISLGLLVMWFAGRDPDNRDTHQRAVLKAIISMGFASLLVLILNQHYFRLRPFVEHDVTVLLYRPTDSSFPAHPAVVGFALAVGMWQGNKKLGSLAFGLAALWGFSRIYAGVSYPSDILVGAFIGGGMCYVVGVAFRLIEPIPTVVLRFAKTLYLA